MNRKSRNVNDQCVVCKSQSWKRLYSVRDFNQDIVGEWDLVSCRRCGLGVLMPFPTQNEVATFYDERFYTCDRKRFINIVEVIRKFLAYYRYNIVKAYLPPVGTLLDFGSGPGHWGQALSNKGWEVCNADVAYNSDSKLRMEQDRPILDYPKSYFDVVTMWYVIEHMVNPQATLREIARVLKPGGILITAQQNFASVQAKMFGPRWLILDPPRHIFQFSPENLSKLANQEGYQLLGINHRSIELGPFTILQSVLNFIIGNENYLFRFLKNKQLSIGSTELGKVNKIRFFGILSAVIGVGLMPFALIAYLLLLFFGSGDIFTLFLQKNTIDNDAY